MGAFIIDQNMTPGCGDWSNRGAAPTTSPHGRLMLTMLGGLADFERELIRARTGEGRKRAMAKGVKFGRPCKLNPHQRQEALKRISEGETFTSNARSYASIRTPSPA